MTSEEDKVRVVKLSKYAKAGWADFKVVQWRVKKRQTCTVSVSSESRVSKRSQVGKNVIFAQTTCV